jgi:hypothetical protein
VIRNKSVFLVMVSTFPGVVSVRLVLAIGEGSLLLC